MAVKFPLKAHEHCRPQARQVRGDNGALSTPPQSSPRPTIEPSRVVLLRPDGVVVPEGPEDGEVSPHEVSGGAGVQLSIWVGTTEHHSEPLTQRGKKDKAKLTKSL